MVDIPFLTWGFAVSGATTPLTMPDRLGQTVNVKDFGALGNGSANDHDAIQTAFNAAFTNSATLAGGTPNGVNTYLNREVFFPNGTYNISSPLTLTQVQGGKITGAGRATVIKNTSGGGCIVTNGFQDSTISHLTLWQTTGATAPALELDWDNTGGVGLTNNLFTALFVTSDYTPGTGVPPSGLHGIRIATSGNGGSNNTFLLPYVSNYSQGQAFETAGNQAINNVLLGGNFQNNAGSILVTRGSVSLVDGVGFQNGSNPNWDIEVKSTAAAGVAVWGCSAEAHHFFKATGGLTVSVIGCSARNAAIADTFAYLDGCQGLIEVCVAEAPSKISVRNGARVSIVSYMTPTTTTAWLDAPASGLTINVACIEIENITYDAGGTAGGPYFLFKQRLDTIDGSTIRTRTYQAT